MIVMIALGLPSGSHGATEAIAKGDSEVPRPSIKTRSKPSRMHHDDQQRHRYKSKEV